MGNLFFSHSSSTSPDVQQGSTSKTCPFRDGCYRCRTQGSTEVRSRPETSPPKDTGPAGYWPAHWEDQIFVPTGTPAPGTNAPIPQGEPPRPPNVHLHLTILGLWQENLSQAISFHSCKSLPWLLPKTHTSMMTDPPLQENWVPALDRDPEPFPVPFLETLRPGEGLVLHPPSLSAPHPPRPVDAVNSLSSQWR